MNRSFLIGSLLFLIVIPKSAVGQWAIDLDSAIINAQAVYVNPGPLLYLPLGKHFTMELKARLYGPDVPIVDEYLWFDQQWESPGGGFEIYGYNFRLGKGNNQTNIIAKSSIAMGQSIFANVDHISDSIPYDTLWHHYALVLKADTVKLLIDGQLLKSKPLSYGFHQQEGMFRIHGEKSMVDQIRIWDTSLTTLQINLIMDSCIDNDPHLALNYPMESYFNRDSIRDHSSQSIDADITRLHQDHVSRNWTQGTYCTGCDLGLYFSPIDTIFVCFGDSLKLFNSTYYNIDQSIFHEEFVSGTVCDTIKSFIIIPAGTNNLEVWIQDDSLLVPWLPNLTPPYSISWHYCDSNYAQVSGVAGSSFHPKNSGSYAAILHHMGCTDTSLCVDIQVNPIMVKENLAVLAYPIPAKDKVILSLGLELEGYFTLKNITGISMVQKKLPPREKFEIDIESLPGGLYFLEIHSKQGEDVLKILKE